jgi:thiosulfate dehydrogenase (quinone) large subunit
MNSKDRGIAILRMGLGLGFLFAGLDKFFMWASGTPFTATGFLKFATGGVWLNSDPKAIVNPTHSFWVSLAGNVSLMHIIDSMVVFGEIAVGVALILGLATRFAGVCGFLLMAMIYVSGWSFANGPFSEAFYYGLIAIVLAYTGAGAYALDTVVAKLAIVQRVPAAKYVLG